MHSLAIGIDLGGTNLKGAAVDRHGRILAKRAGPADPSRGPGPVVADMGDLVDALLSDTSRHRTELAGVGLGTPGPLSQREGRIVKAANLPGWVNVPLVAMLAEKTGRPVTLENDGNAAAFGEFWAGAGRGFDDLVMLTLGTGVGAGVVLDRRLLHGHHENAAELGHTIVVIDGLECSCGQRGCLEQYASAGGVARRVTTAISEGERSILAESLDSGESIDARRVVEAARAGDLLCQRIWDEACLYLAVACVNIQHAFNPACVILGGGMSQAGDFLLGPVKEHLARQSWSLHDDLPEVLLAGLGYDAGVVGAAGLAWEKDDRRNGLSGHDAT